LPRQFASFDAFKLLIVAGMISGTPDSRFRTFGFILAGMPLLTPTERMTLEAIRDLGHALPGRVEWAMEKGYAEPSGGGRRLRLTQAGEEALASHADQRRGSRAESSPTMNSPFVRPWRIVEHEESFEIQSADEHVLAHVNFENEEGRRGVMKRPRREDARRLANQIMRLPETMVELKQLRAARDEPA
jgi:hypothetical protein